MNIGLVPLVRAPANQFLEAFVSTSFKANVGMGSRVLWPMFLFLLVLSCLSCPSHPVRHTILPVRRLPRRIIPVFSSLLRRFLTSKPRISLPMLLVFITVDRHDKLGRIGGLSPLFLQELQFLRQPLPVLPSHLLTLWLSLGTVIVLCPSVKPRFFDMSQGVPCRALCSDTRLRIVVLVAITCHDWMSVYLKPTLAMLRFVSPPHWVPIFHLLLRPRRPRPCPHRHSDRSDGLLTPVPAVTWCRTLKSSPIPR